MSAPATAGSYSYTVTRGSSRICSGSLTISPILTCSVTPNEVKMGEIYTFQATRAGGINCWSCSYTYDAGTEQNANTGTPIVKTASRVGDKTLSFGCTCDNNTSATCSTHLNVIKPKPTFSCAENLKATVDTDDNVNIRLTGITGCEDACEYMVTGDNVVGAWNSGCTGSSCSLPAITNKSKTKGDTAIYVVTLRDSSVSRRETEHECSVTFTEASSCHCTCSTGCDQCIDEQHFWQQECGVPLRRCYCRSGNAG